MRWHSISLSIFILTTISFITFIFHYLCNFFQTRITFSRFYSKPVTLDFHSLESNTKTAGYLVEKNVYPEGKVVDKWIRVCSISRQNCNTVACCRSDKSEPPELPAVANGLKLFWVGEGSNKQGSVLPIFLLFEIFNHRRGKGQREGCSSLFPSYLICIGISEKNRSLFRLAHPLSFSLFRDRYFREWHYCSVVAHFAHVLLLSS